MNDIEMLFKFAGGLGLFLYGMNIMADGLQKAAGNKMKSLLGILTGNRFLAVLVGALVTAIIQSSSATTVMVVGFVNAGLMDLTQAVGVIMGANIGTTITAWLVSMNELGDILKPEFYAPVLVCIGAFLILFSTKNRKKQVGEILVGFGALFIGLSFMSGAITPYRDAPVFANAFMILGKNPILGILTGAVVTAIIQSSSASVGILQTLALNGMVNWGSAIFITLGQNIGTCITALLSGAGAHRTAKRAAVIQFLLNVIGTLIFGTVMFLIFAFNKELANAHINSVQISVFHTIFNITNTIVLFPFANYLVKLSGVLVRGEEEEEEANPLDSLKNRLDRRILESPTFAIETAEKEVANMGSIALKNIERAKKALLENDSLSVEKVVKWEQIINGYEEQLTAYLAEISNLSLNDKQHIKVKNMLYTISDMERVGDHCENLSELAAAKIEKNLEFSPIAAQDLEEMMDKVLASYEAALMARITGDVHYVDEETAYENIVDDMEKQLREKHFVRLAKNECNATIGVYYIDAISNLERISDHADNIAHYVVDEV
ncbi:MAG: Na/Pi cotransporter family protein [Acetivibrio ethanolgignens]